MTEVKQTFLNQLIDAIDNNDLAKIKEFVSEDRDLATEDGIALYRAIDLKNREITDYLLEQGVRCPQEHSHLPVCAAIKAGWRDLVEQFVEQENANLNPKEGVPPLTYAAKYGYDSIVEYLIKQGANVRSNTESIFFAVKNNHRKVAKILLQNGADPNPEPEENGLTLYQLGRRFGGEMMTDLLTEYGAKAPPETVEAN